MCHLVDTTVDAQMTMDRTPVEAEGRALRLGAEIFVGFMDSSVK